MKLIRNKKDSDEISESELDYNSKDYCVVGKNKTSTVYFTAKAQGRGHGDLFEFSHWAFKPMKIVKKKSLEVEFGTTLTFNSTESLLDELDSLGLEYKIINNDNIDSHIKWLLDEFLILGSNT